MQKLFNRILVPVDFSDGSKKVVAMAAEIATEFTCSITLLHVTAVPPVQHSQNSTCHPTKHPAALQAGFEEIFGAVIRNAASRAAQEPAVTAVVLNGAWNECITEYVLQNKIDVIIAAQENGFLGKLKMKISAEKIASETNVPVISLPENCSVNGLYPVVIPVTDFLPVRKIIYAIYMAAASNANIKLLAVENETTAAKSGYYLYKSYKLIRDNCPVKTELEIIKGADVAEVVNEYADCGNKGLVIVNPGAATGKRGFFSTLFDNVLHKHMPLPIMTIAPL